MPFVRRRSIYSEDYLLPNTPEPMQVVQQRGGQKGKPVSDGAYNPRNPSKFDLPYEVSYPHGQNNKVSAANNAGHVSTERNMVMLKMTNRHVVTKRSKAQIGCCSTCNPQGKSDSTVYRQRLSLSRLFVSASSENVSAIRDKKSYRLRPRWSLGTRSAVLLICAQKEPLYS